MSIVQLRLYCIVLVRFTELCICKREKTRSWVPDQYSADRDYIDFIDMYALKIRKEIERSCTRRHHTASWSCELFSSLFIKCTCLNTALSQDFLHWVVGKNWQQNPAKFGFDSKEHQLQVKIQSDFHHRLSEIFKSLILCVCRQICTTLLLLWWFFKRV